MSIRSLCGMALCLSLGVVLDLFVSIYVTQELALTLTFIPLALAGMLYGPLPAFIIGMLTDLLSFFIKPTGPYFPGFTLTMALTGLVFGLFLYRFKTALWRVALAKTIVSIFLNLALNTLWIAILYSTGFWVLLPRRILKNLALLIPEILLLWGILSPLAHVLKKQA